MRQYGGIDAALEKEVKLLLSLPSIGVYVGVALVCIGGVLYIIGALLTIFGKWGGKKPEEELELETKRKHVEVEEILRAAE